jgi:hypothetical protein
MVWQLNESILFVEGFSLLILRIHHRQRQNLTLTDNRVSGMVTVVLRKSVTDTPRRLAAVSMRLFSVRLTRASSLWFRFAA